MESGHARGSFRPPEPLHTEGFRGRVHIQKMLRTDHATRWWLGHRALARTTFWPCTQGTGMSTDDRVIGAHAGAFIPLGGRASVKIRCV